MTVGASEALIILLLIVLIFGAGWLPKAARNIGKAKIEFDKAKDKLEETKDSAIETTGVAGAVKAIDKANTVLKASPQQMIRNAAISSVTGAVRPATETEASETEASEAETTETEASEAE